MWNYKCNIALGAVLWPIVRFIYFIMGVSWTYAHYRNGSFPYQFPDTPRLYFKELSFWHIVKSEWRSSKNWAE